MAVQTGVSDFYRSSFFRRNVTQTKTALTDATRELASEYKSAKKIAHSGNVAKVFRIDKELSMLESYGAVVKTETTRLDAASEALAHISSLTESVSTEVVAYAQGGSQQAMTIAADGAYSALQTVMATLNLSVGGATLFAGDATDTSPLAGFPTLMADVTALVTGAPDAATALANVDAYFYNAGGGFETNIYQGSDVDKLPVGVSQTMMVDANLRADDPVIRDTLRNLAVMATVGQGAFAAQPLEQRALLNDASISGIANVTDLTRQQERLGHSQEQLGLVEARNESERFQLMTHRNDLALADPFETATRLQSLEGQLESIFIVTARLSGLKLVNFIR